MTVLADGIRGYITSVAFHEESLRRKWLRRPVPSGKRIVSFCGSDEMPIDADLLNDTYRRRFFSKFTSDNSDACWIWTGATASGYGRMKCGKKLESAHVLAVLLDGRKIPDGMVVGHKCDRKLCVNPRHLEVISYSQNMRDAYARLQNRHQQGEAVASSQLTDELVREIRRLRAETGHGQTRIARALGISKHAVSCVLHKGGWSHVS